MKLIINNETADMTTQIMSYVNAAFFFSKHQ